MIYGAASYNPTLTAEAVTTVASTNGFKINTTSPGRLEAISGTGDLNNDGYDDIIISNYSNNNLYVLFGQRAIDWDADKTTAATGSAPDIINIDARVTAGATEAVAFTGGADFGRYTIAVANMNTLVLRGSTASPTSVITMTGTGLELGATVLSTGLATHNNLQVGTQIEGNGVSGHVISVGSTTLTISSPATTNTPTRLSFNKGPDLIVNSGDYINVYFGKNSNWSSNIDLTNPANYNGTTGFRIDVGTDRPGWISPGIEPVIAGDVNNDGLTDLIFAYSNSDDPVGGALTGTSFVALQPSTGWNSIADSGTVKLYGTIFMDDDSGMPASYDPNKGFRIHGSEEDDYLMTHTVSDVNGDGKNDILLGLINGANKAFILWGRQKPTGDTKISIGDLK